MQQDAVSHGGMTPGLTVEQTINPTDGTKGSILEISPDTAMAFVLVGSDVRIWAKLRDSAGHPLPELTEMRLRFQTPAAVDPIDVTTPWQTIRPYVDYSLEEQDGEHSDKVRHSKTRDDALVVEPHEQLDVVLETDTKISWDHSELYIDARHTRVVPVSNVR